MKGNKLKAMLDESNMTQKDLADMSGLTEAMISRMVNGSRYGSLKSWIKICEALQCSLDEIIEIRR